MEILPQVVAINNNNYGTLANSSSLLKQSNCLADADFYFIIRFVSLMYYFSRFCTRPGEGRWWSSQTDGPGGGKLLIRDRKCYNMNIEKLIKLLVHPFLHTQLVSRWWTGDSLALVTSTLLHLLLARDKLHEASLLYRSAKFWCTDDNTV